MSEAPVGPPPVPEEMTQDRAPDVPTSGKLETERPPTAVTVSAPAAPPPIATAEDADSPSSFGNDASSSSWYKHPLILRAAERLAYALASAIAGVVLLYADARLTKDVIKRRLWRRRREGESEGTEQGAKIFRGLGRHMALAVSASLKLCAGVALTLASLATASAVIPGIELKLRLFTAKLPGSGFAHTSEGDDDGVDDVSVYPRFFKQFFDTAIALLLLTAVLVFGTLVSAAMFEVTIVVNRIFDRLLHEGSRRVSNARGKANEDKTMSFTPPLFSQQGAEDSATAPWKKYMALHALEGTIVAGFVYFVVYSPFRRELKKLRALRECPSSASLSKLLSFRDWPAS